MILIDSYMCHGRNMVYGIWGMVIHPTSGDIAPIVGADSHPSLWDSPWLCIWPRSSPEWVPVCSCTFFPTAFLHKLLLSAVYLNTYLYNYRVCSCMFV